MFRTLKNAFAIPELRKKIFYTLLIIAIFRIGAVMVPVPGINPGTLAAAFSSSSTDFTTYISMFTGGGFEKATFFALAISPYITASIIVQLLTVAIPAWEKLSKEGEDGRKKLGQITRVGTILMAAIEGTAYYFYIRNSLSAVYYTKGFESVFYAVMIVICYIAGSALMMWLAEQINIKGIGNGISIILFAGIVANFDSIFESLATGWKLAATYNQYYAFVPMLIILMLAEIYFVVYMNEAERRIPVQYAKRVVGRKLYGGQNTNIPIKVNMANVLPVIFANSLLQLPTLLLGFGLFKDAAGNLTGFGKFLNWFSATNAGWGYMLLYVVLIIAFGFFYIGITYNPVEIANNLRKQGGAIPAVRPGKPTSDYISKIVSRIVLIGSLFLCVVVLVPMITGSITGISLALGGTTIIIVVGVALETATSLESQMLMRHYKGFLE